MNATCCPDHDTLEAYLQGNVDDDAIDVHLDQCAECQQALDRLDRAVNQPFACLAAPAPAAEAWEQPAYQQLVTQAKAIDASHRNGHSSLNGDVLPAQAFGNYRLLELLARSMNPVYKAQHLLLKKTVVLKLLGGR